MGLGLTLAAALLAGGFGAYRWVRQQSERFPQPAGEQEVTIAPLGLTLARPGEQGTFYSWRAIREMKRSRGYLLLQAEEGLALGLPERVFARAEDIDSFLSRATDWLNDKPAQR